ncbi:hypothetical protein LMH87_004395 [Akanthomyces muscarius]|uniref:Uncharacterized protein n=1 Tax=Akanthomyces muscarius TaxID=2231603 RepID=A0A9W8Q5J7_AKAMU|nr:hypothetical protein LMH87_004395 [Akanthomyces muscarius]KAJ4145547.1 hypothetical protein LMH87_004395 [Akanthomyces muscarius]
MVRRGRGKWWQPNGVKCLVPVTLQWPTALKKRNIPSAAVSLPRPLRAPAAGHKLVKAALSGSVPAAAADSIGSSTGRAARICRAHALFPRGTPAQAATTSSNR